MLLKKSINKYHVIGIMSGTSLDGLDICYCLFQSSSGKWNFSIKNAITIEYTSEWKRKLSLLYTSDALTFCRVNSEFGNFCGNEIRKFINQNKLKPQLIASHGHTVFHQPASGFTAQIGSGAVIAAITGITTVCDFRSSDVAYGGQGAPLVPTGDKFLFPDYDYCLNLGGISNISFDKSGKRTAFDICPVNMALNYLANKSGKNFDTDGKLAAAGKTDSVLLNKLNALSFYKTKPPKSLGIEWFNSDFKPLIDDFKCSVNNKLRTVSEHIAIQIAAVIKQNKKIKILVTGGGAKNKFLMKLIYSKCAGEIIIPGNLIIDYKEALIFALLGVLRWKGETNNIKTVTGAVTDNIGGCIYLPAKAK